MLLKNGSKRRCKVRRCGNLAPNFLDTGGEVGHHLAKATDMLSPKTARKDLPVPTAAAATTMTARTTSFDRMTARVSLLAKLNELLLSEPSFPVSFVLVVEDPLSEEADSLLSLLLPAMMVVMKARSQNRSPAKL